MKQFTIVFDKKQSEYATILNTLVSEVEDVKNVERSLKVYQKGMVLTDKDCVLFVGDESSRQYRNNFKDKYSRYGIHLGYRGCKAWIYCEKFNWDKKSYKMFYDELLDLYKRLDMNPTKVQDFVTAGVKEYCTTGTTVAPNTSTIVQQMLWIPVVSAHIVAMPPIFILGPITWLIYKMKKWIKSLFAESTRIDQQYRFAIALFFSDYLKKYLKIACEENTDEENTDEENG